MGQSPPAAAALIEMHAAHRAGHALRVDIAAIAGMPGDLLRRVVSAKQIVDESHQQRRASHMPDRYEQSCALLQRAGDAITGSRR